MIHSYQRLGRGLVLALLATACSSDNNGGGSTVTISPGMTESAIASAFSTAAENSTIEFKAGTFKFTNSLNLASKTGITVKGAGIDQTILDFSTQTGGGDGVVQSNAASSSVKVTFQDFTIIDTPGDGLKITGGNGVFVRRVKVGWPTRAVHGGYGIYPVQSKNVLVENSVADGASDTGIYVGQSDTIIVRNNTVTHNVSGLEIENSFNADVTGNNSNNNTVGFLVFDLPNLPQVGGHNVRVYNNMFTDNNTANFADVSGTVALVPAGTGGAVMANSKVEVFSNTFSGNTAVGFAVISCFAAFPQSTCLPPPTGTATTGYLPFPGSVYAHDNTFTNNGTNPLANNQNQQLPSFRLAYLLQTGFPPTPGDPGWADNHVADVVYDGILSPISAPPNPYMICAQNNGSGHFANMHLDQVDPNDPHLNETLDETNTAAFSCTLPALPAVTVPGA
jgi:parallel beta-helix repeat protein